LDFTGARDSEWQWHQLGRMQVCTSIQTDNHASTPPLEFSTGRMPFLLPNQQCQSTEGKGEAQGWSNCSNVTTTEMLMKQPAYTGYALSCEAEISLYVKTQAGD